MIKNLNIYNYRLFTWSLNLGISIGMLIALVFNDSVFFWIIFIFQFAIAVYGFRQETSKLHDNGLFRK